MPTMRSVNVLFPYISDILNCMFYEHKSYLINFIKYMKCFKIAIKYCCIVAGHGSCFLLSYLKCYFLTIFDGTNIEP